jgi:predicted deacylase
MFPLEPSAKQRALPEDLPFAQEPPLQSIRLHSLEAGPRLIVTAAVHGNELHGTHAMRRLLGDFGNGELRLLRGQLTLVPIANPKAWRLKRRHGDRNLNRRLLPCEHPRSYEDYVANWLCPLLAEHEGLLDLHSFQSGDAPFALFGPQNNRGPLEPFALAEVEEEVALRLGCERFVHGWLQTYTEGMRRRAEWLESTRAYSVTGSCRPDLDARQVVDTDPLYGVGTTEYMRRCGGWAVTFECGQHEDPEGCHRAYRAIVHTLAYLGMIDAPPPIVASNPSVLGLYSVVDRFHDGDSFAKPWRSFDPVRAGERIGTRAQGDAVVADRDAFIVFPNTRARPGQEWFYLACKDARLGSPSAGEQDS